MGSRSALCKQSRARIPFRSVKWTARERPASSPRYPRGTLSTRPLRRQRSCLCRHHGDERHARRTNGGHAGFAVPAVIRCSPGSTSALSVQGLCPTAAQGARTTLLVMPGARCFNDAYVAAADWRWRSADGNWASNGGAYASMLGSGPPRLVPDGTTIRSGDTGTSAEGYVAKEGGEHWVGDVWAGYADPKFNDNDVGYSGSVATSIGMGSISSTTRFRHGGDCSKRERGSNTGTPEACTGFCSAGDFR